MHIQNYKVLIKPEETQSDLIAEICDDLSISADEPFAFSAIETITTNNLTEIKVNCLIPHKSNPYTPTTLINSLFSCTPAGKSHTRYVQPPLDQWLNLFTPLLHKMVHKAYPFYQKLFTQSELLSTLYLTVVKLYKKNYYLHNTLIYRSFINELNMEVRHIKRHQDDLSIDTEVGHDTEDNPLTIGDTLIDQQATDEANELTHYTLQDYWQDMFEAIKAVMLDDMSQLSFDRIMIQIQSRTITPQVSRQLKKYRELFNPDYIPRPNARGFIRNPNGKNNKPKEDK